MDKRDLIAYQQNCIAKRKAELEAAQAELDAYKASEQYLKDQWDANEQLWVRKAKKEGWNYTPKPYVSEFQRQQEKEQATLQEIAFLKAKLAKLEGNK